MKTYIQIHAEPDTKCIFDGKTGNPVLDNVVKILYKKFPVFELVITTNYKFDTGFMVELRSHDDVHNEIFGILTVEYQIYHHKVKSGEPYYSIQSHREESYEPPTVSEGYAAYGNDFEEVLTAFLMETEIKLQKYINHLQDNKDKLSKLHPGCYDTKKAGFSYVESC